MKNMKKFLALALALILVLSLATTVSAADTEFTIQLNGSDKQPTTGHTYTVYQIFTGELEVLNGKNVLVNVKYGKSYTPGENTTTETLVPTADLEAITDARAFAAKLVADNLLEEAYGTLSSSNEWKLENVPAGYYLIQDTTENLPDYHTRSAYIVEVVENVNINPKSGIVDIVKHVKDKNDTTGEESGWQDSADYDIGDNVPYQIVSNISEIGEFKDYKVVFTDTMSKGLTYNNDAVIKMTYTYTYVENGETKSGKVENAVVTDKFTPDSAACTETEGKYVGGTVLTLSCNDIKAIAGEGKNMVSATITIDYTAKLNENATTGEAGNPNKVNLTYDREPDGDGTGTTPDDVNIVFTFKVSVDKVDQDQNPLVGATFALYKQVKEQPDGTKDTDYIEETKDGETIYWDLISKIEGTSTSNFAWNGIDDGIYMLKEVVAPEGYNSIDPIIFEITATHDTENADPKLTVLDGGILDKENSGNLETGVISGTVENKAGITLPETGGMGTTIFYIVGGILVLAAVVLLVTKKRMASAE